MNVRAGWARGVFLVMWIWGQAEARASTCSAPGPCWADQQSYNIGALSAAGRTGQWWCDNHFGANLGGSWECIEGTGSWCQDTVPPNTSVQCGKLNGDGSTPYYLYGRSIAPFGYGRVERHLVTQYAPGRTGQWWCDNHFGQNLGGWWKCRSVSGSNVCTGDVPNGELVSCAQYADVQSVTVYAEAPGQTGQWWCDAHFGGNLGGSWDCLSTSAKSCATDAVLGEVVRCGRYTKVDEGPFAPQSCSDPALDAAEREFCQYTEYMTTRRNATLYAYNDYLRAGFNRSFGGALFELYGPDKRNRIEQHGGSAVQLSLWGYDVNASGAAYFTNRAPNACSPVAYSDPAVCQANNGGLACRYFPATGAQVSDCVIELACGAWSAGAPWNPIQAQATGCGWDGSTNDVDSVNELGGTLTLQKSSPYHFTKSTAMPGMTFQATGAVASNVPYLKLTYSVSYGSARGMGEHNQEIPALFTKPELGHWYYFYEGASAYADVNGPVTRLRSDFGRPLLLPGRTWPWSSRAATEEWMTTCDRSEATCLTVAIFSPVVRVMSQGGQYVTPLGRFGLGTSFSGTWDVYLFPYRHDDQVAGRSVRQWIYDLKAGRL